MVDVKMLDGLTEHFKASLNEYAPPQIADFFLNRNVELMVLFIASTLLNIFLYYVILTKSKNLGTFKYYLLNQAIWTQCLEIYALLCQPISLSPFLGGFTSGIFRNIATTEVSYLSTVLGYIAVFHTFIAVCLSLLNRFVFVFCPSLKKRLHNKYTMGIIVLYHVVADAYYINSYFTVNTNRQLMEEYARNDTGNLLDEWINEKTMMYMPENGGLWRTVTFFCLCLLAVGFVIFIAILAWFIVKVIATKSTSKTVNELSTYLLTTVLVQAGIFLVCLYVPSMIMAACWAFAIENSANVVNAATTCFGLHGTANMISTLYFVKPYKLYCISLMPAAIKRRILKQADGSGKISSNALFTTTSSTQIRHVH